MRRALSSTTHRYFPRAAFCHPLHPLQWRPPKPSRLCFFPRPLAQSRCLPLPFDRRAGVRALPPERGYHYQILIQFHHSIKAPPRRYQIDYHFHFPENGLFCYLPSGPAKMWEIQITLLAQASPDRPMKVHRKM